MEQNSESSVIEKARQGDQDAIGLLYEETKNYAYFVARRYLQNDEDIADILQDAYISVFSNLGTFEDGRPFKPWLHSIVTNKCLNFIKSKRAVFVSPDEIGEIASDDEEIIPAAWLERAEKRRDIIRIIDGLPEGQRMAVTLFYFEGLSISEMAGVMGVAEGTVKAHLYYGRKTIKEEVLREEKKGNKLYAIVPLPLLTQLFELEAEAAVMPEVMSKAIWEGTVNSLTANGVIAGANTTAAGTAVNDGAGGVGTSTAAASTATGLAAKIAAMSVTAKIIAAVVAAVVITVGIIAGITLSQPSAPVLSPVQIVDTEPVGTEPTVPIEQEELAEPDALNTNYSAGDIFTFGTYNGEPIEWRVLEVADGKTLIIAVDCVDVLRAYNNEQESVTWETCTLRSWLNNEFYNAAFSGGERSKIVQTTISTPDSAIDGARGMGGNDTSDKLFLLSIDEATQYFANDEDLVVYYEEDMAPWWLRSPGISNDETAYVNDHVVSVGAYVDNIYIGGVRPALWLTTPGTTKTAASADYASAYKRVLLDNREAILGADLGGLANYLFADGNVNVADINGDGTPELLFTLNNGSGFPTADMHIYSYVNGSAVQIFTMGGVRAVADSDPQVEVLLSPDGTVMTSMTGDKVHGDHGDTYITYEFDNSGMLVARESITSYGYNESEPELEVLTYYRNGEVISESEYNQLLMAYTNSDNKLVLFSNQYYRDGDPQTKSFIMSFNQAIDYLDSL